MDEPDHVQFKGGEDSFSLIGDERPLTEHVHLASPRRTRDRARVSRRRARRRLQDHGGPGERAIYPRATTARSS